MCRDLLLVDIILKYNTVLVANSEEKLQALLNWITKESEKDLILRKNVVISKV